MVTTLVLRALLGLALGIAPHPAGVPEALEVLHQWDAARASAYAHDDAAALGRLYVPGSAAGAADRWLLRAYAARGYRVVLLRPQVFSAQVLAGGPDVLRLRLVDRVIGALMGHGHCALLPTDAPRLRVVELRRVRGGWRVAEVRVVDRAPDR